ncbi:hypothetical protein BLOT_001861, partial [Blomia tropicalis]
ISKSELRKKNNKDCVQRNRFGFENSCEFFKLNGVTPWNTFANYVQSFKSGIYIYISTPRMFGRSDEKLSFRNFF